MNSNDKHNKVEKELPCQFVCFTKRQDWKLHSFIHTYQHIRNTLSHKRVLFLIEVFTYSDGKAIFWDEF